VNSEHAEANARKLAHAYVGLFGVAQTQDIAIANATVYTSPDAGRRRYGTLVAVLLEACSTLTDEILDLHDRFVGSINKARRKRDEAFQSSGKSINESTSCNIVSSRVSSAGC
jgi:hypothetical protein